MPFSKPKSAEEAASWSLQYWPTNYKKQNPFGPQHNIVEQAQREIEGTAALYMGLANSIGRDVSSSGLGKPVGTIIVDRSLQDNGVVLAAAGDARWAHSSQDDTIPRGNVMGHSVMRAIGMIAQKRLFSNNASPLNDSVGSKETSFATLPITSLEHDLYQQNAVQSGGYLCLDLEIYVSHEPCVMCTMAMLHSRVGRIVFGTQMRLSGGLLAVRDQSQSHQGLQYGLFWRPELNWKCLVWQWIDGENSSSHVVNEAWHA